MKFNEYLAKSIEYQEIFETIFNKYYEKGYFGNIEKDIIKSEQKKWFLKLIESLEKKQTDKIIDVVTDHNNKLTREFFSEITGMDIKKKKKKDTEEVLRWLLFCDNNIGGV